MVTASGPSGKSVVVTGAARGLGAATVSELSQAGWAVIGVDTVETAPPSVDGWVTGDVRDAETLHRAILQARARGGLGGWVNNAAIQQDGTRPLHTRTRQEIDRLLGVNLLAPIHATAVAAEELIQSGLAGAIVNVSSIHGVRPSRGWSVYAAAKAGLEGLTRAAAAEYGPHGIRVNAVAPGQILSQRYAANIDASMSPARARLEGELMSVLHPIGHATGSEEVACVIEFLLSSRASAITGAVLPTDGGRVASDPYDALVAALSQLLGEAD